LNISASSLKDFIAVKGLHRAKKVVPLSKYHENKLQGLVDKKEAPLKKSITKSLKMSFNKSNACTYSCTPECLEKSRNHLQFCSDDGGSDTPSTCTEDAREILKKRSQTSSDQDINDAVRYCQKQRTADCLTEVYEITKKRSSTTTDDDVNLSFNFCAEGGRSWCVTSTYETYRQRSGTSLEQDVQDSINECR